MTGRNGPAGTVSLLSAGVGGGEPGGAEPGGAEPGRAGRDWAGRDWAGRAAAGRDGAGRDGAGRDGAGRDARYSLARAAVASLAVRYGGVLTGDAGDGLTAAFARPGAAAACALAPQREIPAGRAALRIGVHSGEPENSVVGGPALSHCAWLRDSASPGQVVLSQRSADLAAGQLPAGAVLADLGWHRLPDLGPPEQLWQLCHPALPATFPPLRTMDPRHHNLPVQLTSFVGRHADVAEIGRLLREARLVTLTGSGGCGKTRLALQVAAGLLAGYPDGAWLVELARLRDPGQVTSAIAAAFSVPEGGAASELDAVTAAIGDRAPLLVLDNCEHLVNSCAEVTEQLLRCCPRIRILATSREPLAVPGEATWRVPSLSVPPGWVALDELGQFESVQLFAARARWARSRFALTEQNAAAVAEICGRLDGIPLAIELAAARTRVLSPGQIAAGLHDRFELLTGGARTATPRQQTLEASVAWSYGLLAGPERVLLRRLSAFAGDFTLAAAQAVGAAGEVQPDQVLGLLSQLADKSLILGGDEADSRFGMLETIRHYAARRLAEANEADSARCRHFGYFCAAAARRADEREDAYRERLRLDYDDIRRALEWAAGQEDPELLLGLATRVAAFWSRSTRLAEARHWLHTAVDRSAAADPALRARALGSLAQVASLAADMPTAMEAGTEGLALLRELGDSEGMIVALTSLGSAATIMGEPEAWRPYLEEAAALAEQIGDQRSLAYALALTGRAAVNRATNRDAGRAALRLSVEIAQSCGAADVEWIGAFLLGVLDAMDCRPSAAAAQLARALPALRAAGDGFFLSFCLAALVHSQALLGDFDGAQESCRELDSIGDEMGTARLYFAAVARGRLAFCRGEWPQAVSAFREQLSFYASVALRGMWAGSLAWSELLAGQSETARQRLDDFLRTADEERTCLALPLAVRALVARADGDLDQAEDLASAAVAASPADPFGRLTVWTCLVILAAIKADSGSHEIAARLAGAAAAFSRHAALTSLPAVEALTGPAETACRSGLGTNRFAAAWSAGEGMTLQQAAAYASRGRGKRRRPVAGWPSLTPTEMTVARAVAEGLSNPQIAERMFISRRTVTTHLTAIFRKLRASSRAQVAAAAVREESRTPPG